MPLKLSGESAELAERLGGTWLTTELDRDARLRLARLGRVVELSAQHELTHEGEPTAECGVVLRGRVALRTRVPERGVVTLLTVEPGDIVGWSALAWPYRATSTAVTTEPTEMAMFDGARLRAALERDPHLAAALYPLVLRAVSRRLVGTRLQLLDLFTHNGTQPW